MKKGESAQLSSVLDAIETFANETSSDEEALRAQIEAAGVDTLGVPSADIAVNSWSRQNIRYVDAQSARGDLEQFASIFGIDADLDALLTKGVR
ncbi:MAG: hypothetical protein ACLVJ6_16585 [Merdibacter sp.]